LLRLHSSSTTFGTLSCDLDGNLDGHRGITDTGAVYGEVQVQGVDAGNETAVERRDKVLVLWEGDRNKKRSCVESFALVVLSRACSREGRGVSV